MLPKKLFRWMHKIALFAIVFASLAPGISHALAAKNGTNSFAQQVCTSDGKKVTIQVTTTQGQQLAAEFSVKATGKSLPQGINHPLEHCPFCASHAIAAALPVSNLEIIALLEASAQKAAEYAAPFFANHTYVSPPSQAPPQVL